MYPGWPTKIWAFVDESEEAELVELAGSAISIRTYRGNPRNEHIKILYDLLDNTVSAMPQLPIQCGFDRIRERSALARYIDNIAQGVPRGCMALVGDDTTDRHQFAEHWLRFECLMRDVELITIDANAYSTPEMLSRRLAEIFGAPIGARKSPTQILREIARNSASYLRQPCALRILGRPEMWGLLIPEFVVPLLREQRRREARLGIVMEFNSDRDLRENASELFKRRDVDSFEESVLRFTSFSRDSIATFLRYGFPLPPSVRDHVQPLLEMAVSKPPQYFLNFLSGIYQVLSGEEL